MRFIEVEELYEKIQMDKKLLLIDVRSEEEFKTGHVPEAKLLPLDTLLNKLSSALEMLPEQNVGDGLYVICLSDRRSLVAAKILAEMGVPDCIYVKGGTKAWAAQGYPLAYDLNTVTS